MTTTSTVNRSAGMDALISGELIDLLVESVVLPKSPFERAVVIGSLLAELYTAVEWLHGDEAAPDDVPGQELASLRQLMAAGQDHQRRMKVLGALAAAVGGRT